MTVTKTLIKDIHILFVFEEGPDGQLYGLANTDLTQIKPNYDAMIKGGTLKVTEMGIQHGKINGNVLIDTMHFRMFIFYSIFDFERPYLS